MAHSRLNKNAMFDWIERCLQAGEPTPADAAIVDRFVFHSTEQARTLLADLADAGRITIKGYGETRTISLGRSKPGAMPAPRVAPSVKREDRELDAGVAKITSILARHKPAKPDPATQQKLIAALTPPTKKYPEASPPAPEGTIIMKPKTICLPGSSPLAIEAVEARAKTLGESLGVAAADLIIAGSQTIDAERWTPPAPPTIDGLLDQLRALFADRDDAAIGEMIGRAEAAEARADAAEAKLAQLRAALA